MTGGPGAFVVVWCLGAAGIIGAFVVAGTSITGDTLEAMVALKARPVRLETDDASGPGVFAGRLWGPARTAPDGEAVVGWIGWVDKADKGGGRASVCRVSELDGLSLERGERSIRLHVPQGSAGAPPSEGVGAPTGISVAAPQTTVELIPQAVRSNPACAIAGQQLQYHQIALHAGQDVVVSGCRAGDRIAPCGDRADFLFSRCAGSGGECRVSATEATRAVLDRWRSGVSMVVCTTSLIVGGALTAFAFAHLWRHRALQRRRRSACRPAVGEG